MKKGHYDMWERTGISCKWAPAVLVGESVPIESALDYIFRTDRSFFYPEYACNDRKFCDALTELIGVKVGHEISDFNTEFDYQRVFDESRGAVYLQYLSSAFVASSYIFGPHGPVHPDGTLGLEINFGKWPSIEEIENELGKISEAFPWFSARLYVWDNHREERTGDPDFGWSIKDGMWERIDSVERLDPEVPFEEKFDPMMLYTSRRETTWTIEEIERMWGERISSARAAAGR